MCTLTIAYRVFPDAPIAVAANRDELLDRPASPPDVIAEDPRVVAPRDEEAGGTWIGYNDAGVFVAITNRWVDADLAGERSRGLLVRDALEREDAEDAARSIERELEAREYEPFNLVIADATAAVLFEWDGFLRVSNLAPGVHVVMNAGVDDEFRIPESRPEAGERQRESSRLLRATLAPEPGEDAESWLDRAAAVLGDHEYGVCVHGDGFGTRSSSLIALRADGTATYRYADGPPCETDFEPVATKDRT